MALGRGFAAGFLMGMNGAKQGLDVYNQAKQKEEIEGVANAQVNELAPVSDLTATPSEDGGPAVTTETQVAPKQFSLLGKTYDQAPTDSQQTMARNMAMAGIMKKYDPARGMQMEQAATASQRDEQRFGREQEQWKQQDEERKRDVEYRTGRERLLKESPMGQQQAALAKFEQDTAAYNEAIKAGKPPQELGLPPQKPNTQRPGPMQTMAGYADLIAHDYKYGKLNTDGLIQFQDKMQTLEKENYSKALLAAQSGGTPEQVAKAFNSAGMQIDPKNVTITRTKQANGPDQVMLGYTDDKGQTANINVMAELEGYDKAKQVFDRFYQSEGNRRGNEQLQLSKNADGRAGAAVAREQAEKTGKANAAAALFQQRNPNATAAEIEAVRRGVIDINPDNKNAPSEVKLAQAMVNAGLAPDMRSGLEMAITKKTQDPGEMHKGFVEAGIKNMAKPEDAVASADKVMETMGYGKSNGRWSLPKGQAPAGGMASDPKAIAIRDDKNLSTDQKRAKLKELGYQ